MIDVLEVDADDEDTVVEIPLWTEAMVFGDATLRKGPPGFNPVPAPVPVPVPSIVLIALGFGGGGGGGFDKGSDIA